MSNSTNITYGSYDFQQDAGPVPLLTINKEFFRTQDSSLLGSKFTATLRGELNLVPSGIDGYTNVDSMQDQLLSGFSTDCQEFKVVCDATTLLQVYPRVNSIRLNESRDNWSHSTPFEIELEWDGENYSGLNLTSISENWNLQFDERSNYYDWSFGGTGDNNMYMLSLTHQVSAQGVTSCNSNSGWKEARSFVHSRLGYNVDNVNSGVFNLNLSSGFSGLNHSRVEKTDIFGGQYSVDETWLVVNTDLGANCGAGIEDFTANVSFDSSNGLTNVSIQGSIEGLESIDYGAGVGDYAVTTSKYENASGFWNCLQAKLPNRANLVANTTINPVVLNTTVGHNPTKGVITYSYTYDNRPCNFITNALSESISVSDNLPTDVFAEIAILGRAYGPVLQSMNTVTSTKRIVSIEALMGPTTGCSDIGNSISQKPDVSSLLCSLQQEISGANTQLFLNQNAEEWDIKSGRYRRTVGWTYVDCSGSAPSTSFC